MSSRSGAIATAIHRSAQCGRYRTGWAAIGALCAHLLQRLCQLPATLVLCLLVAAPASAQVVTTLADNLSTPPAGSLRAALNTANASGSAASITFNIAGGGTINLAGALPILRNPNGISIDGANSGQGAITIDGGSTSATTGDRIFFVGVRSSDNTGLTATPGATWSIANLTLQNGNARGGTGGTGSNINGGWSGGGGGAGLGGAIFVNEGNATLSNVQFLNNRATGGNGGSISAAVAEGGSGAGAGMGGNGGNGASFNAGGGGGFGLGANGGVGSGGAGSAGRLTGATAGGAGSGTGFGAGGANGGGGGGSNGNQNGGGGGPGGEAGTTTGLPGGAGKGGNGAFGGGGGASGGNNTQVGGTGGFGGGGGGAGAGDGGPGGFGGGGGGGAGSPVGVGGFGAGDGAASYGGGGGGAGLGGAIFVRQGATLALTGSSISGGIASGGGAGPNAGAGQGIGTAAFLAGSLTWSVPTGQTITLSSTLGGGSAAQVSGGLTKSGPGTLILNSSHSYVGATAITGGQLQVNGSLTGTGALSVSSGATLSGSGTISGAASVASGGILAPGPGAPGRLQIANMTLTAGATLAAEISGATVATQYDQLDVTGSIALGGATLSLSGAFVPGGGQSFVLVDNDGSDPVSGTFAGLPNGGTVVFNGVTLTINYAGGDGNDVVLTVANPCAAFVFPYTLAGADNTARVANLRQAIQCANGNGSGADTILLNGQTVDLPALNPFADYSGQTALPQITSVINIRNGTLFHDLSMGGFLFRTFSIAASGTLNLQNMELSGASAPSPGGAFHNSGTLNLTNSTIHGYDTSNRAGVLHNGSGATATITNSLLYDNNAVFAHAIDNAGAVTIVNSTFDKHTSVGQFGAVLEGTGYVVRNSIFWNPGSGPTQIATGNTVSDSIVKGGYSGGSNILNTSPLFVNETGNDFRLQLTSPAINIGVNAQVPLDSTDVDGDANTTEVRPDLDLNPRIVATVVDLGAYERQDAAPLNPAVSIAVVPANVAEDGVANLVYTVTRNPGLPIATTVNISTGGTAASPSDYSGAVATVVIPANSTTATITIDPTPDSTVEPNETVILGIASGTGYTVGAPASVTGTIDNDDTDPCAAFTFPYTLAGADNTARVANLRQAIQCANGNGAAADVINLNGQTVTLADSAGDFVGATGLPQITTAITLRNGTLTRSGAAQFRLLQVSATGNLVLRDMTLSNGGGATYAADGGIVTTETDSVLTIINSTVSGGSVSSSLSAGGIFASGTFNLVNSTVSGNTAGRGGGLLLQNGPALISNSVISGNVASNSIGAGGAMYLPSADVTIVNSTITGNYATATGATRPGGILSDISGADLILRNSIVWGNRNGDGTDPQIVNSSGTNAAANSLIQGGQFGALNSDPLFVTPITPSATPSTAGNFQLGNLSPAIDAGANANVPADSFDLNGNSNTSEDAPDRAGATRRVNDTGVADTGSGTAPIVDIGAFEKQTSSTLAQLTLTKTAGAPSFVVGVPASFTLQLSNTGTAATTAVSTISDPIPVGLTIGTLPAGCSAAGQTVTCTVPAGLAAGGSTSFVIPVTPTVAAAASITNTASVSGGGDPTCPAAARCSSAVTVAVNRPQLTLTKTASSPSFTVGTPASFTLQLSNTGTAATTAVSTISDPIPAGLTIGTLPAGCSAAGQTVTCTVPAGLAAGGSTSFVIPVTPTVAAAASITNTASVSGGGDSTCPAAARCSSAVTLAVGGSCAAFTFPYTLAGADNTARVANLRQAIQCANLNGSTDTIDLDGQTVTLSDVFADYTGATGLPEVSTVMTVRNGTLTRSGPAEFRFWYVSGAGNLTLELLVVTNGVGQAPGQAGGGGAIYTEGVVNIIGGRFSGHYSALDGGAVHIAGGAVNARFAIFSGNFTNVPGGGVGGAFANSGGVLQLSNVLVAGNRAVQGGGIYNNSSGIVTLINTTIAGNATNDQGGGLRNENTAVNAVLNNTLISGNESSVFPALANVGGAVTNNFSQIGGNPLYVSPLDASDTAPSTGGDYRLGALSPMTDAGSNALSVLPVDLAGNPRRYDDIGVPDTGAGTAPIIDIGAYERQTDSPFQADLSITKTDGQTTDVPGTSITYTITASNAGPLAVATATVADTFPASITGVTWTCVGAGGGTCPAAGSGNLNATVGLPVGGSVSFTATGTISAAATGTLSNTATVSSAVTDPTPGNDSATDTTTLATLPQLSVADVSRSEGNSGTTQFDFTVSLSSPALAGGVSFDIATANGTAIAGSDYQARSLTGQNIPAGSSTYTFSVQVNGDLVAEANETFVVDLSNVSGASLGDGQGQGTINNDDTAGVVLVESGGDTAVTEGGAVDDYTLALTSQPSADVTLVVTPGTQLIAGPSTLTFTPANWNVAQTVTVGAVNDGVVEGPHTGTLTHATSGGGYDGVTAPELVVDITDNDTVEVVFTGVDTATPLNEQGSLPDSYTVRLGSVPAGGNSVSITIDPAADCEVQIGAGARLPVATLTTSTQTNTTVRIFPINDQLLEGPQDCAVTYTIDSADPAYDALTRATDTYAVVDNESASYGIAALPLFEPASSGDEGSSPATLAVYALLNASGTGMLGIETPFDVDYSATAGTATGGGTDYNLPAGSVRFDASTPLVGANAVESFTFNVIDDLLDESDETLIAQVAANEAGTSGAYDAAIALLPSRQSHTYTILDNDSAAINVTPTSGLSTTEAGGTATFTVVLGSQPSAAVNVGLSSSDASEGTVAPTGLSFSTANWNIAQTVTVTGVDDALDDGDIAYSIVTALATSADSNYAGLNPADVAVSNVDNDAAGVTIVQSGGTTTVTEGGATDSFSVVLTSQPSATVSVDLSGTQVSAAPSPLSFSTANWNIAQTVTVTAIDDAVIEGAHSGSVSVVVSSADSAYAGLPVPALSVAITDNDSAAINVTPTSGLSTTEAGGTATFTVVLGSQPSAAVNVGLSSSDASEGTVAPTGLSFSTANWNIAQTVTLTGVDDALDDGDIAYSIVTALATSADSNYAGLNPADVAVSNVDNDAAPSFSPGPGLSRQQGSPASSGLIGTVADADEAAGGLQVSVVPGGSASGITVSAISNSAGLVSAQLAAGCSATDGTLRFEVRDATALTATAELQIDVLDNSAPQLAYGNQALSFGGNATVTPGSGPTDNGSVSSIVLQDTGTFAGTVSVGAGGVVSLGNAQPAGGHVVLIRATDDCGASTDVPLNLSVGPTSTFKLVTADVSPSRFGQTVTFSAQLVGINPTGSVEFFAGGSSLGTAPLTASPSGGNNLKLASLSTSALPVGSVAITAVYAGDAGNAASTSPVLPHSVLATDTRVQVSTASNPATPGSQLIQLSVSPQAPGGGVPQGSVTVTAGALQCTATLSSGSGSCALNLTAPGMIALGASYTPSNGNHLASTGTGAVVIVDTPSSTDLRVRISNGLRNIGPGQTITWMVVVDNLGSAAAVGRLEVPLGTGLTAASWFCGTSTGAQCGSPASGQGAIDSTVSLAPGGVLAYAFTATIAAGPEQPLTQTATITPVSPTTDPVPANNTASDTDPMGLLADGFESEGSE